LTVFSITCFYGFGSWLFWLKVCIPILCLQDLNFSQWYLWGSSSLGYNTVSPGAWFPLFWSNVVHLEYGIHLPNTVSSPERPKSSCFYFLCNPVILSVLCTFIFKCKTGFGNSTCVTYGIKFSLYTKNTIAYMFSEVIEYLMMLQQKQNLWHMHSSVCITLCQ